MKSKCNVFLVLQTGKSFTLNEALPAIANKLLIGGGGSAMTAQLPPIFLRVNCYKCSRYGRAAQFLSDFLGQLKSSASEQGLSAGADSVSASSRSPMVGLSDFMEQLPRDRLTFLLLDEVQSFYLLARREECGGGLDLPAIMTIRR